MCGCIESDHGIFSANKNGIYKASGSNLEIYSYKGVKKLTLAVGSSNITMIEAKGNTLVLVF